MFNLEYKTFGSIWYTDIYTSSTDQPQVPPPALPPFLCALSLQSSSPANLLCKGWILSAFLRLLNPPSLPATLKKVGAASTNHLGSIAVTLCMYSRVVSTKLW
jgi:hypothetical protein